MSNAISMALISDPGGSSTDQVTSSPAIRGTGKANTLVTIRNGKIVLGTTMADSTGAWSFTPTGLADGSYTLTASQTGRGPHHHGGAELHPRHDGAGGEHGAGSGHRQLD